MLNAQVLTFREFMTHESLPLSTIHEAVLDFLQGREDVVLFGAQAVNAYIEEPRMTQDVDLLSTNAENLAEQLRELLNVKFNIAVRVRKIADGRGFRVYQIQNNGNRHLVDLRAVESLPDSRKFENVLVLSPAELVASKIVSYNARRGKPKAGTDWRDLAMLLLKFPELKKENGEVAVILRKRGDDFILEAWKEIVAQEILFEDDDESLIF